MQVQVAMLLDARQIIEVLTMALVVLELQAAQTVKEQSKLF